MKMSDEELIGALRTCVTCNRPFREDHVVLAIERLEQLSKSREPPDGCKRLQLAIAADDDCRVGVVDVSDYDDISSALSDARNSVEPVIYQAIATIYVPRLVVPEVVGTVESPV